MSKNENNKIYSIDELKKLLSPVFVRFPVAKAYVFGSYARGEAFCGDDVDLVVSPTQTMDLEEYYQFLTELQEVLHTRPDITFEDYINPFMLADVMGEAVLIYEK